MPRSLADGRTKFTVLTTEPANPASPTATELNAGIELTFKVMTSDFAWGPTDSDKVAEKALGDEGNANVHGASNYQAGMTLWRYYATAGGVDATDDAAFAALKVKGTTLWGYARRTDKKAAATWAASDEIYFGAEFTTDTPQPPSDQGGFIKWRIPAEVQRGYPFIAVATGV